MKRKQMRFKVIQTLRNETTKKVFKDTTYTNSKVRAEQMKKNYICLGNNITVLEYHLIRQSVL